MTNPDSNVLELLLADISGARVLNGGLDAASAERPPLPDKVPPGVDAMKLDAPDADPNDLSCQRWGIIIPDTKAGDAMLEAITPLCKLRAAEQGGIEPRVFRARPGMNVQEAFHWKNDVLRDEDRLPADERPRYLLILGDLDGVSAELGYVLANGSFVGRIHFDDSPGYAAYAEKVVRLAKEPTSFARARADFLVAQDDSPETRKADLQLVEPCRELALRRRSRPFAGDMGDTRYVSTVREVLNHCASEQPRVLLSVGHGIGRSAKYPWASVSEQRRLQGALLLDATGGPENTLTAESVAGAPFLPGGLWFMFACFGAGTPSKSAFYKWLKQLAALGRLRESADDVLASLPVDGEKPFIAALPKAALANPQGPLAILGHLDLAWAYSFTNVERGGRSQAARIFSSLNVMVNGSRVGVAHDALMQAYREVNHLLSSYFEERREAEVEARPCTITPASFAHTFMLRNDLQGYVLLGDPAVRLPLAGTKDAAKSDAEAPAPRKNVAEMEQAVLVAIAGNRRKEAIAAEHDVDVNELDRWIDTYQTAGREALGRMQ
ncbi:MAG: hypothetical protein IPM54_25645 [Polyangiaceae bacterium]|nr:hypothetical protein [Polyangiaceae bacterium]